MAFTPSCAHADVYEITLLLFSDTYVNASPLQPSYISIGHVHTPKFISQTNRRSRSYLFR